MSTRMRMAHGAWRRGIVRTGRVGHALAHALTHMPTHKHMRTHMHMHAGSTAATAARACVFRDCAVVRGAALESGACVTTRMHPACVGVRGRFYVWAGGFMRGTWRAWDVACVSAFERYASLCLCAGTCVRLCAFARDRVHLRSVLCPFAQVCVVVYRCV